MEEVIPDNTAQETGPVFLRTVIRRDVYDRLKSFAMEYETGRGDWDFGVAIQLLLDSYFESRNPTLNEKLDLILSMQSNQEPEEPKIEKKFVEMLGGTKIEVTGE